MARAAAGICDEDHAPDPGQAATNADLLSTIIVTASLVDRTGSDGRLDVDSFVEQAFGGAAGAAAMESGLFSVEGAGQPLDNGQLIFV